MFSKIHEECGVFGIYTGGGTDVAGLTYSALFALQHRGQESCGIAVNDDGVISGYKDLGLVGEVFPPERLQKLGGGQLAVGHVRYATTGRKSRENAQPLIINHIKGSMALAHNGNLTNAAELREALELNGAIFHTTSDTEVIAYTITNERLRASSIEEAVSAAMDRIKGAYSLVIMSPQKLIAVRDPTVSGRSASEGWETAGSLPPRAARWTALVHSSCGTCAPARSSSRTRAACAA